MANNMFDAVFNLRGTKTNIQIKACGLCIVCLTVVHFFYLSARKATILAQTCTRIIYMYTHDDVGDWGAYLCLSLYAFVCVMGQSFFICQP